MERSLLLVRLFLPMFWLGDGKAEVCSMGELSEIGPGDRPDDIIRNALYVIPQPIQYCGTLTTVQANGFYFPGEMDTELRLELRVYQLECDGTHANAVVRTVAFTPDNISDPHGIVMNNNVDIFVIEGDLIAISAHSNCNNKRCPIQPTILPNATSTTTPPVWYNQNGDINDLTTRTDALLNIRVSIEPIEGDVCALQPSVEPYRKPTNELVDCSPVGQLKSLDNLSIPHNNSGIYILPEHVKYCGRLVSIKTNGFFTNTPQTQKFTFRVHIFRPACKDGMLKQFFVRRIDHIHSNTDKHGTITITENLGIPVMRNDLIGVRVDSGCFDDGRCPFQPAIMSNSASQVLFSSESSVNTLEIVTGIFLNIEALIDPTDPIQCRSSGYSDSSTIISLQSTHHDSAAMPPPRVILKHTGLKAGPVVGIVVSVLFVCGIFVTGITILCIKRKKRFSLLHKQNQPKIDCFTEDDITKSSHAMSVSTQL